MLTAVSSSDCVVVILSPQETSIVDSFIHVSRSLHLTRNVLYNLQEKDHHCNDAFWCLKMPIIIMYSVSFDQTQFPLLFTCILCTFIIISIIILLFSLWEPIFESCCWWPLIPVLQEKKGGHVNLVHEKEIEGRFWRRNTISKIESRSLLLTLLSFYFIKPDTITLSWSSLF